ncbi:MAG: alpha/beta fold hydrolase [Deltaproteobacteria bacterium]|nr:MAG: alpha/beta fold hydrolase [Deltaproteobacteria bacterium]
MLMTVTWIFVVGLGTLLLLAGFSALSHLWARAKYGYPTQPDCVEFIHLPDGWSLGAERHFAKGERKGVVVTCHGMIGNHFNMDLGDGCSMVQHLKQHGYEVWNVDLRGTGHSRLHQTPHNPTPDWSFDDHVRYDIPAFLDAITSRAGVEQIHWIGHSMGGMIMYAYLGCNPEETRIASLVAISSPATWTSSLTFTLGTRLGQFLIKLFPYIPLHYALGTVAPYLFRAPIGGPLCYPPNLSTHELRRSTFVILESFSVSLCRQFARMYQENTFNSEDGTVNYRELLPNIKTPTYLLTGVRDKVAPPQALEWVYEQIGSSNKKLHIGGRKHGDSIDHCHASIAFSQHASQDTYPRLVEWLTEQSP